MKRNKLKTTLDEDTTNYYIRVDGVLKDQELADEAKGDVINNLFSQLCGEAVKVCQCPQLSPIIERILPVALCANVRSLLEVFSGDLETVCKDKCSSHVVQQLICVLPKFISEKLKTFNFDDAADNEDDESVLILKFVEVGEYFLENLEETLTHSHMSHICRAALQVLGGIFVEESENVQKSRASKQYGKQHRTEDEPTEQSVRFDQFQIPDRFRRLLKNFYKKLFRLNDFGLYLTDRNANPVIQTLLLVLHKADLDLCQKAIHKVIKHSRIKDSADNVNLPPVVADNVGSFLIQRVVSLCSEELFQELYMKLFKGKLLLFATHNSANFVLQNLIRACKWEHHFNEIVEELSVHIEGILVARYYGVIVAMAETAVKISSKQDELLQRLMESLQCWEPVERQLKIVTLVATLTPFDTYYGHGKEGTDSRPRLSKVNYHGSLLLQHLLKFKNTKLLETSVLDMVPEDMFMMSCDPCGSHVIESFFQSKTVRHKAKEGVLSKLGGVFVQMACNKNGSRTLESVWSNLDIKHRKVIATELCKQEDKIRSDRFGRHIHRNFALFHFNKRNTEWVNVQKYNQRKRQMFSDFLDDTATPNKKMKTEGKQTKKKKKKKKKSEQQS